MPDPSNSDSSDSAALAEAATKPLDVDGVSAVMTGTVLFAIGFVVLSLFHGPLAEHDATWWIWMCATGAALGVVGSIYTRRRRAVYQAAGRLTH